jgi:hypothetical protein
MPVIHPIPAKENPRSVLRGLCEALVGRSRRW